MNPTILEFLKRFVNNPNAYARQQEDGSYLAIRNQSLTPELVQEHLNGIITLGAYSTNPNTNQSLWICIDIDSEQEPAVDKLFNWLAGHNLIGYRESIRPGKSGHVWLHFSNPLPTSDVYRLAVYLRLLTGLVDTDVFPRQPSLKPESLGNLVRLPLGRHRKESANGALGLYANCPSFNVYQQLDWFIAQPVNDSVHVLDVISGLPNIVKPEPKKHDRPKEFNKLLDEFPDDWGFKLQSNGELTGRCPNCAENNNDNRCANLYLNTDKNVLYCHRGCSFMQILQAITNLKATTV